MKFATRIRQVPFGQLWNNDAAALDAHLESVQFGGDLTQAVVGLVETLNDARVRGIVKTMSAQEPVKGARERGCRPR